MSKKDPPILAIVKYFGCLIYFLWDTKVKRFIRLSESHLSKMIPGYTLLNEKARKRELDSFIKCSEIIKKINLPAWLPNAPSKPSLWRKASKRTSSAHAFLAIGNIFESSKASYRFMADMLCAPHCESLREAEPSFSPTIAAFSDSPEIHAILKQLVKSLVLKSKWGNPMETNRVYPLRPSRIFTESSTKLSNRLSPLATYGRTQPTPASSPEWCESR